jgi:hypothetical protein
MGGATANRKIWGVIEGTKGLMKNGVGIKQIR